MMPDTFYPIVKFTKKSDDVPTPRYAHEGDAGMDLCATEDVTLYPGESCKMGSGIFVAIPEGFAGFVLPRSGLGCKGLVVKNNVGLIDSGYRGEIGLTLFNNNPTHSIFENVLERSEDGTPMRTQVRAIPRHDTIEVHKGDRVAQLVILPVASATMIEVDELDSTSRGTGGFGSTGTSITGGPRL